MYPFYSHTDIPPRNQVTATRPRVDAMLLRVVAFEIALVLLVCLGIALVGELYTRLAAAL
ncbi:MAG TPA: hypothetical protein VM639_07145 [Dongiaceae bacterium]|nr:hypothetical protein [Dongiaceae bacterium]